MALADDVRAMREEIREARDEVRALNRVGETYKLEIQKHEEQLNGKQGVFVGLDKVAAKMDTLTKAAWSLVAAIIVALLTFAVSVLQLVH